MNYDKLLKELEQQEKELQFTTFTNEDAIALGMQLYERAQKEQKPVSIDITRHGQQLFHIALPGTSPDQDQWIQRKAKVVNRFNMSSYHMGIFLKSNGVTLEDKFNLSSFEYAPHGGSFPILIKNAGVIGTITVSGLPQAEDHAMVVDAIRAFIE